MPTGPSSIPPPIALPRVIAVWVGSMAREGWARVPAILNGLVNSLKLTVNFPVMRVPIPSFGAGLRDRSSLSVFRLISPFPTTTIASVFNARTVVFTTPSLISKPLTKQCQRILGKDPVFLPGPIDRSLCPFLSLRACLKIRPKVHLLRRQRRLHSRTAFSQIQLGRTAEIGFSLGHLEAGNRVDIPAGIGDPSGDIEWACRPWQLPEILHQRRQIFALE